MQQIQLNCHDEYEDYDPFGHVDADGNDVSIASDGLDEETSRATNSECSRIVDSNNEPKIQTCATDNRKTKRDDTQELSDCSHSLTLEQKYPNFGWMQQGIRKDDELQITCPEGDDPTIYGSI